jgi:hypothetical protein
MVDFEDETIGRAKIRLLEGFLSLDRGEII